MALRIRLARYGAKKRPFYRIVVSNSEAGDYHQRGGSFPLGKPRRQADGYGGQSLETMEGQNRVISLSNGALDQISGKRVQT
jgi:hypothetical protein